MKNTFRLWGIAAVIAGIALFAGCTNPADEVGTIESFTVTFNLNGGSGTAPSAQTVQAGSSVALPGGSGFYRSGYTFGGWNTNASGTGTSYNAGSSFTPSGSGTLYAKWNAIQSTFTVTFNANGGSETPPAAQTVNTGSSITLPGGLSRNRYAFNGWNTKADGTGTNYAAGSPFTPSGSVTLYAQWEVIAYNVAFNLNGGTSTVPASRIIEPGSSMTLPDSTNISRAYATFTYWNAKSDGSGANYAANSSYTPTGNVADIILYAQWDIAPFSSVTGLANKLAWLEANAQSDTSYTIEVNTDEDGGGSFFYNNKSGITITLRGVGANRTIRATFFVGSGTTLILDNNITLRGYSSTINSLVRVYSGGTLRMNAGSTITGNNKVVNNSANGSNGSGDGGGVYVSGGTFTMNGGEISGNTVSERYSYVTGFPSYSGAGGGVYVSGGTFTMNGGNISGNTAGSNTNSSSFGGGVYVSGGTFIMNGGEISSNTTVGNICAGGGVCVSGGTFTMNGGEISGHTTTTSGTYGGSGVYVGGSGTFTMSGGIISDNTDNGPTGGSGVYVGERGTFTMSNGTISGNTATTSGGGVYVNGGSSSSLPGGTFTMSDGTISGNTASTSGGGVYVRGAFDKTGGTIYGYSEGDTVNSNTVKNSSGTVVHNQGHAVIAGSRRKEITAGPGVNLSYGGTKGTTGGWDY